MVASSSMPRATLTHRVEVLEHTVAGLAGLPARVAAVEQSLAEFRVETGQEFVAVRQEMADGFAALRQEMAGGFAALRAELRAEIREGDEETRRYMRCATGISSAGSRRSARASTGFADADQIPLEILTPAVRR
jgi:hypothetical protein